MSKSSQAHAAIKYAAEQQPADSPAQTALRKLGVARTSNVHPVKTWELFLGAAETDSITDLPKVAPSLLVVAETHQTRAQRWERNAKAEGEALTKSVRTYLVMIRVVIDWLNDYIAANPAPAETEVEIGGTRHLIIIHPRFEDGSSLSTGGCVEACGKDIQWHADNADGSDYPAVASAWKFLVSNKTLPTPAKADKVLDDVVGFWLEGRQELLAHSSDEDQADLKEFVRGTWQAVIDWRERLTGSEDATTGSQQLAEVVALIDKHLDRAADNDEVAHRIMDPISTSLAAQPAA